MLMKRSRREFLLDTSALVATSSFLLRDAWAADTFIVADTTFGKIRGVDANGICMFKGIPYGASTAGKNRFMPPANPVRWTGVKDTLEFGASAPQNEPGKPVVTSDVAVAGAGLTAESEDCLVLNVWTPAVSDGRKRPVMFWCHGGGFSNGSGSSPITDGANLARRGDVVVVTVNHRLNVLGFANLTECGPEFTQSGDAGMLDLVQALTWVRDNISQFGGDPSMVTIFGQSGGGRKVATLLAMPAAKGLFHRAIIESGPAIKLVDPEDGKRAASALLSSLNLSKSQVRELQALPVDRIMTAYFAVTRNLTGNQMNVGFAPTVDGKILPQHPFHPSASAVSATVPLMIGCARTELTTRADEAAFSLSDAAMRERVQRLMGNHAETVIDVYRKANPGATPSDIYFLISSDQAYGAPTMKVAERRAALGQGPVYLYYFCWESPMDGGRLKSPHTVEIPFAFDTVKAANLTKHSPDAQALADKVSDAWIAFARRGDPNTPKLPRWPAFDPAKRPTMVFNNQSRVENDPIREQRLVMFKSMDLGE